MAEKIKRYYKAVTISNGHEEANFKIRPDSERSGIVQAIRNRFGVPDSQKIVLVDKEGADVVVDSSLTTGKYTLVLPGSGAAVVAKPQVSAPQPAKEDLSRMEGAYGAEVIGKLKKMKVFIKGLRGLGIETAKNLILTGPHTVVVQDDNKAELADLGANFYLEPKDAGKPRGPALLEKLAALNPNVNVKVHTGALTEDFLSQFQVVVIADHEQDKDLIAWNAICRSHGIVFLYASVLGMQCSLFADYGDKFVCMDADGEPVKTLIVDSISNGVNGIVTVDVDRHLLSNGDHVKLEEVKGMSDGINDEAPHTYQLDEKVSNINQTFVVKTTKSPKEFLIANTSGLGVYNGGGIITQVKVPVEFSHKSFAAQLSSPRFEEGYMDFMKFGREQQLHLIRLAVQEFFAQTNHLPRLHHAEDANAILTLAEEINKKHRDIDGAVTVDEIDANLVQLVSLYARAETSAIASLFGGVVAQEVTKQTGKYKPITQWFHFDAFECLDAKVPENSAPQNTRYDHQISLFGAAFQEKLESQNIFLVGCGALGCEYLKAIAVMGLGVKARVSITDDDTIDLSNLSRQFLFRLNHVGKAKSITAAESAIEMNHDLKSALDVNRIRVEQKSENLFNDSFWGKVDIVINALDNMIARKYMDEKCVFYQKPLFESGTLGTKANTAICLPHKTPSYSEGAPAGEEGGIAMCTLRNFPSLPLHCIEWARTKFDESFVSGVDKANSFLEDRKGFFAKLKQNPLEEREALETAKRWLQLGQSPSYRSCVEIIWEEFHHNFRNQIKDLISQFPEDSRNFRTTEDGEKIDLGPFWSGAKRFPNVATFDKTNDLHVDFVYHGASILASIFGVEGLDRAGTAAMADGLPVPAWVPSGKKIKLDEEKKENKMEEEKQEAPEVAEEDNEAIARLIAELSELDPAKFRKLQSADFEKDVDSNHHVDFITSATNLRSFNYGIKPSTRASVRMVAGKIIPAIATTTAMITGFVQLEVIKYIKDVDLTAYRGATANLATNTYCVELLPDPVKKKSGMDMKSYMQVTAIPEGFTCWDKVIIKAPGATLAEFLAAFSSQHHGVEITMISADAKPSPLVLYNTSSSSVDAELLTKSLYELYVETCGPVYPEDREYIVLDVSGDDPDGNTAIVPSVVYYFKW